MRPRVCTSGEMVPVTYGCGGRPLIVLVGYEQMHTDNF